MELIKKMPFLECGRFKLSLNRPLLMGILNLTPDSFSDGGLFNSVQDAVDRVHALIEQGADIIDIGAESSRPGATPITADFELLRLAPLLKELTHLSVPISIDTYKPEVMRAVLDLGADMINDISGFRDARSIAAVASSTCGLCVMHMQGSPDTMQQAPVYQHVASDVEDFLDQQVNGLLQAGINTSRIALDVGFGFGKTHAQNLALFRQLARFSAKKFPLVVGVSRKSMLGILTGKAVHQRENASVVAAIAAYHNLIQDRPALPSGHTSLASSGKPKLMEGGLILRVHDVGLTKEALTVWDALAV